MFHRNLQPNPPGHAVRALWFVVMACIAVLSSVAQANDKFRVAILLFDDVQIIDFAAPYEVFGQAGFEVFTVSGNGKPVTTVMGLSVNPAYSFTNMPEADAILVPGGDVQDAMHDKAIQQWLKQQKEKTGHILSVCTGSHILAESGLLDSLSATTFHNALDGLAKDYPSIDVQYDKRFVDNGQIVTSAGLSSGIDASLHLVSKVLGMDKAKSVALHIEYDWDPEGGFVRGMMADRHFPENDYDWPQGILFDRKSSLGDEKHWQTIYTAQTSASADELMSVYRKAMAVHKDWIPVENPDPRALSWKKRDQDKNWVHHFSIGSNAEDGHYQLVVSLQQAD